MSVCLFCHVVATYYWTISHSYLLFAGSLAYHYFHNWILTYLLEVSGFENIGIIMAHHHHHYYYHHHNHDHHHNRVSRFMTCNGVCSTRYFYIVHVCRLYDSALWRFILISSKITYWSSSIMTLQVIAGILQTACNITSTVKFSYSLYSQTYRSYMSGTLYWEEIET